MWFLVVEESSKWPEIHSMGSAITDSSTIDTVFTNAWVADADSL